MFFITVYSLTLEKTFVSEKHFQDIQTYRVLEEEMCRSFEKLTRRKWREGNNKTSFNYLLLDPRISSNLPKRAREMEDLDSWKCFLSSIFYIGKGKRSRPYAHLHKAVSFWEKKTHFADKKVSDNLNILNKEYNKDLLIFTRIIAVFADYKNHRNLETRHGCSVPSSFSEYNSSRSIHKRSFHDWCYRLI